MTCQVRSKLAQPILMRNTLDCLSCRLFSTSHTLDMPKFPKMNKSGVYQITKKGNLALTYEMAQKPHQIGVRKSWNSWNTSTLYEENRAAETNWEDVFIRKFIEGTFPKLLLSETIIKRRHNVIYIAGLMLRATGSRQFYFLIGYTEEMLGFILKCPIKLEIQTVEDQYDVDFKHI